MILACFLLTSIGALLLYLASPNQNWLNKSIPVIPAAIGAALLAIALTLWIAALSPAAGFFAWLVVLMLLWGAFPFMPLLKRNRHEGA